jgi:hypothetical protein
MKKDETMLPSKHRNGRKCEVHFPKLNTTSFGTMMKTAFAEFVTKTDQDHCHNSVEPKKPTESKMVKTNNRCQKPKEQQKQDEPASIVGSDW